MVARTLNTTKINPILMRMSKFSYTPADECVPPDLPHPHLSLSHTHTRPISQSHICHMPVRCIIWLSLCASFLDIRWNIRISDASAWYNIHIIHITHIHHRHSYTHAWQMGRRVGETFVCHTCDKFTICFTGRWRRLSTWVCLCLMSENSVWGHWLHNPDLCWSQNTPILWITFNALHAETEKGPFHIGVRIIYLKVSWKSGTGRPTVGFQVCRPSAIKWGVMNIAAAQQNHHN